MINSLEELRSFLVDTILEKSRLAVLEISGLDSEILAISIAPESNLLECWQLMREKLALTQRWPVIVCGWDGGNWINSISFEFSRHVFNNESTQSLINRAEQLDVEAFFHQQANTRDEWWTPITINQTIESELELTRNQFGAAPSQQQLQSYLDSQRGDPQLAIESYLFNWELQYFPQQAISSVPNDYWDWYQPENQFLALALLPTQESWQTLVYLHWYAAETIGSDLAAAILKSWQSRYGAEIVAHYGTMLQLLSQKRPIQPQLAFQLAWQQYTIAPCTLALPGVSLRDHARALLHQSKWFLHERP